MSETKNLIMLTDDTDAVEDVEITIKRQSQLKEIWKRFIRSKTAVFGLCIIIMLVAFALFAEFIAPYGIDDQLLSRRFTPPCKEFIFGTDEYGRDIFSRIVYGSRTSLSVGIVSVSISCVIGVLMGSISGFYGNRTDNIIMRAVDVMLAIPQILLAISITAALGPGLFNVMLAVGISTVPAYARIVRGSILSIKDQEFIEAARSIGASDSRIIVKHVLPNCLAPIIVQATMSIATAILSASSLSFIGLGISPPTPEWGAMLSAGRAYVRDYWFVVAFPGLMIMLTVFAFNLFGDGLRDALDPRLKG